MGGSPRLSARLLTAAAISPDRRFSRGRLSNAGMFAAVGIYSIRDGLCWGSLAIPNQYWLHISVECETAWTLLPH